MGQTELDSIVRDVRLPLRVYEALRFIGETVEPCRELLNISIDADRVATVASHKRTHSAGIWHPPWCNTLPSNQLRAENSGAKTAALCRLTM